MNTAPSITSKILRHLQSGRTLTALQCLDKFGTMRLGARVHELRSEGHAITSEIITKGGKKFARYSMKP